jgi:hypothetical protein
MNKKFKYIANFSATSVNSVQVLQGLNAGDTVILSDMSNWDAYERIRLR